jgi:membrane protease YdiL (CAAX protease family)
VLIAAAAEVIPAQLPPALLIVNYTILALVPVALVVFLRQVREIEHHGPRTRPDLFMLPDLLAVAVIFAMICPVLIVNIINLLRPAVEAADGKPPPPLTIKLILENMLHIGVPALALIGVFVMRGAQLRDLLGFGRVPVHRALGLGVGLGILALSLTTAVKLVVLSITGSTEPQQKLVQNFQAAADTGNSSLLAAIAVSAVVVAPFSEEVIFRGAFYPVLSRSLGRGLSAVLTAVMFALVHDTLTDAPSLAVLALCFALAYEATGSLLVPIFMHATFNGTGLLMMWLSAKYGLPGR